MTQEFLNQPCSMSIPSSTFHRVNCHDLLQPVYRDLFHNSHHLLHSSHRNEGSPEQGTSSPPHPLGSNLDPRLRTMSFYDRPFRRKVLLDNNSHLLDSSHRLHRNHNSSRHSRNHHSVHRNHSHRDSHSCSKCLRIRDSGWRPLLTNFSHNRSLKDSHSFRRLFKDSRRPLDNLDNSSHRYSRPKVPISNIL